MRREESASWLRADLARHLATLLDARRRASAAHELVAEIDRLAALAEQRCVPLGPEPDGATRTRPTGGRSPSTSPTGASPPPAVLDAGTGPPGVGGQPTSDPSPRTLTHRITAAEAIAGHDRLVLVVGPAGTGKTYTTAHAVAALRAQGRPVVGLAPSGKAADVLAHEAGCRDRHHRRVPHPPPGTGPRRGRPARR